MGDTLVLEEDKVNAKDTWVKEETEERNIVLEKQPEKATEEEDSVKDIQIEKLPDVAEEKEKINVQNEEGVVGKKRVEDIQLDDVNNKVSEKKSETKEVEKEQYNRGESNVKDNDNLYEEIKEYQPQMDTENNRNEEGIRGVKNLLVDASDTAKEIDTDKTVFELEEEQDDRGEVKVKDNDNLYEEIKEKDPENQSKYPMEMNDEYNRKEKGIAGVK